MPTVVGAAILAVSSVGDGDVAYPVDRDDVHTPARTTIALLGTTMPCRLWTDQRRDLRKITELGPIRDDTPNVSHGTAERHFPAGAARGSVARAPVVAFVTASYHTRRRPLARTPSEILGEIVRLLSTATAPSDNWSPKFAFIMRAGTNRAVSGANHVRWCARFPFPVLILRRQCDGSRSVAVRQSRCPLPQMATTPSASSNESCRQGLATSGTNFASADQRVA